MDERLERHLCNLHNEVFEAAESRINTEVPSLYVRVYRKRDEWPKGGHPFPHYTWGYIVLSAIRFWLPAVPSLYVRVYRVGSSDFWFLDRSLTIREGISLGRKHCTGLAWFPHYTWGYIGRKVAMCWRSHVPSLYVRVYRHIYHLRLPVICSLTIREGISDGRRENETGRRFPHYTWGYITRLIRCKPVWRVPSLYVRVYRPDTVLFGLL